MKNFKSISGEILLVVILATALSATIWGVFDYAKECSDTKADLRSSLKRKTDRISHSIVYPAWNLNLEEIDRSIMYEMESPTAFAILLRNENGAVISGKLKSPDGQVVDFIDNSKNRLLLEKSFASDSKPIIKNNLLIGTVQIYVTDNDAKERLRKYVLYIIIQMTTLSVIIALSIFIILRRRIVNPLVSLDKSVRNISSENLEHFTEINRNDEIGRLSRSFNVMVDVLRQSFRERDALNLEVIKREEQFLAIVSNVPGAIYRISLSAVQTVLYMSERILGITGISAEELVGSNPEIFRSLVHENDREILNSAVRCAVDKNTPYDVRYRITYRNGDVRWLHEIGQCCSIGDERYLDGVIIDETELREKDYLLVQSQKMETVGTLAGGIAHDFNNILSGIMGGVSMLKMKLPDLPQDAVDSVSKYIALIEKSSLRAVEMTRQLLSLSKRQELRLSPVDLNEPVNQVAQICQNTLDKSVRIEIESDGTPAFVNADAVQIEQLLLNLCVNAAHAMTFMRPAAVRWGGVINISLKTFAADKHFCEKNPQAAEALYWEIEVKDTGIGMDAQTRENIFTPFYTKKEKGAGSGLGLSMVYSIVTRHNGVITVDSEPGKGSEFRVFLPAIANDKALDMDPEIDETLPTGFGTVLVVDDEEIIRENCSDILQRCDYKVLLATNGEEGLQQLSARREEISLVILDMVMPVLSGRDAYFRMREIAPRVKILLSSGNRDDTRVQELLANGVDDFIQKPYPLHELARKVHRLVNPE